LPLSYGSNFPAYYFTVPEDELEKRVEFDDEICVIDDEFFFIRGCLDIPILDGGDENLFTWNVWCSLSRTSFERILENWENANRVDDPPCFGWLNTSLPGYPETLTLKTNVVTRELGMRPFVELEPTVHPLAIEQRTGITLQRVQEIAEIVLHNER